MTLTLNFQGQIWNLLYLCQKWSDCYKTKKNPTYWLNSMPQMVPTIRLDLHHDLHLEFSRSNVELAISHSKMVQLPWNKSKHMDWTLGLKCGHQILHWPWPWVWIFKVKFGICYISAKNDLIAAKRNVHIKNELKASMTIKFDLGNDLERWGVGIYQIVTGVSSDVGVPLTPLVLYETGQIQWLFS